MVNVYGSQAIICDLFKINYSLKCWFIKMNPTIYEQSLTNLIFISLHTNLSPSTLVVSDEKHAAITSCCKKRLVNHIDHDYLRYVPHSNLR